jgi:unspecific monooxygenase
LFGRAANDDLAERSFDGWMRARQLGVRAMTRSVTKAHGNRILAAFDSALRETAGRDFDVVTVMYRYTSRMVADFLFGPEAQDVVVAAELRSRYAARFLNSTLTVPRWLPVPGVRRTVRADERVRAVIAGHVADRRSRRRERPQDMLDLLLADIDSLAPDDIIALLKASMLASVGSPAVALSWALCELARNPVAYERLRDEARHAIAETGSLADDAHLGYSKAFAREILRLYPPTWLMGRTVRSTCTLGGWTLSTGQQVVFSQGDNDADLRLLLQILGEHGLDLVLRTMLSPPGLPFSIVKIVVPGIEFTHVDHLRVGARLLKARDAGHQDWVTTWQ